MDDTTKLTVLNNLKKAVTLGERPQWDRLTTWIRIILGQQTNRANVELALNDLKPYRTAEQLQAMAPEKLDQLIAHVRFHNHKTVYIKALVDWYLQQGGDEADFTDWSDTRLRQALLQLPGIGEETADTMLLYTFQRKVFIADRYAMLLFNRLGAGPYTTYRQMQQDFAAIMETATYEDAVTWHNCIDHYGRDYNKHPFDDSWLLQ